MSFVPYADGTASDVEYESVKFNDLTSCYTYNPLFTSIKSQSKTVKDENNFIQWVSPNEKIHFEKSTNDGYLDLIWIYGKPTFNSGSGSKEGTKIVSDSEKINVITKMDLKNYRYVVEKFFTTLTDDNHDYTKYTRDGQAYTELQENEKIHGGVYYWLNVTNNKTISNIYPVIRYVDTNSEKMIFYPHLITELNKIGNVQSTGIFNLTDGVAENTDNIIYFMMHDIDKSYSYPGLHNQFNVGGDNDISYMWYNESKNITSFYPVLSYEKFKEVLALLGVYFRIGGVDYLGFMDSSGQTTGDYLTEENWDKSSQHNSDTINNFTKHEPPRTDIEGDELDDSEMTLNANGNSFIKWFAVTGQNLLSLIDSFNSESVPAGFVPLDHIVGVYQAPFNIPDFSNCGSLTNIFVGKYDTNVQGMPLLNQGSYSTTGIIASKYIEPTHNNFLDYEPYTSLSLYLPFCGSCNLDANLFVGKTVNVNYYFDIFSGDVIANVYANGTLYKTLSGNFTISQPITSQNVGLQKDTVIKGAVGVATNMLGTAGFAMSGNISGALSGAVGATISSISTYTHLNGISPVATKGGGGRSIFYTCKNIILYKSTAIENHGAYEKYKGKVCNYDSKLSECHGYTVVNNPHLEIKCTNTEKDEITKLLEQGVILP